MIDIIADLHLHSKYSRAVSPQMILTVMSSFGQQKGIDLLSTGDFTHPLWFREIRSFLEESEEGLYRIRKKEERKKNEEKGMIIFGEKTRFLLSVEIATIFSQNGKGRRIHQIALAPSFEIAEKINKELIKRGCNLSSDGRPIIGLSSKNLLQLLLEIDERCLLIPAHIWTPWFGLYGQMSGFTSLEEAFEDLAPYVYGIETGLSSDPEMNWQIGELANRSILSFSDAHSPAKIGREATVFRLENLSYSSIREAIMKPSFKKNAIVIPNTGSKGKFSTEILKQDHESSSGLKVQNDNLNKVLYTIEFYPEEGKYHYSGHRNCGISMTPQEQEKSHNMCPVCKRSLTDGVMRRVQELADDNAKGSHKTNNFGLTWITDPKNAHPPFVKIVPLQEIISEAIGSPFTSPKVKIIFDAVCKDGISEFNVLLKLSFSDIEKIAHKITSVEFAEKIADGVKKVRAEQIVIIPGYDGVFGTVKIWEEGKDKVKDTDREKVSRNQGSLFS